MFHFSSIGVRLHSRAAQYNISISIQYNLFCFPSYELLKISWKIPVSIILSLPFSYCFQYQSLKMLVLVSLKISIIRKPFYRFYNWYQDCPLSFALGQWNLLPLNYLGPWITPPSIFLPVLFDLFWCGNCFSIIPKYWLNNLVWYWRDCHVKTSQTA